MSFFLKKGLQHVKQIIYSLYEVFRVHLQNFICLCTSNTTNENAYAYLGCQHNDRRHVTAHWSPARASTIFSGKCQHIDRRHVPEHWEQWSPAAFSAATNCNQIPDAESVTIAVTFLQPSDCTIMRCSGLYLLQLNWNENKNRQRLYYKFVYSKKENRPETLARLFL